MSNIILQDKVRLITDEEVQVGKPVLMGTWQDIVGAINYLNFYARTVAPWHQWVDAQDNFQFVWPATGGDYTNRQLCLLIAQYPTEYGAGTPGTMTIGVTSGGGNTYTFQTSSVASTWSGDSEAWVEYFTVKVVFEPDSRELVTVTSGTPEANIVGFGAWELPPVLDGSASMIGPGLTIGSASIDSAVSAVNDPSDFLSNDYIDATKLGTLQAASDAAWQHNRRVVFMSLIGLNDNRWWRLDIPSGYNLVNTAYKFPTGGIYIPPYGYSKTQELASERTLRAAVFVSVIDADAEIRWTTSRGSTSWETLAVGVNYWFPLVDAFFTYDRTRDGTAVPVGFAGEWVYLELRSANAACIVVVKGCEIWEDEP